MRHCWHTGQEAIKETVDSDRKHSAENNATNRFKEALMVQKLSAETLFKGPKKYSTYCIEVRIPPRLVLIFLFFLLQHLKASLLHRLQKFLNGIHPNRVPGFHYHVIQLFDVIKLSLVSINAACQNAP